MISTTLRNKDTRRTEQRLKVAERKQAEKRRLRQEVQQLQAVKRRQLQERLAKIRELFGEEDIAIEVC